MTKPRTITPKQQLFAQWYYTPNTDTFGNGVKSAKKAGYNGSYGALNQIATQNIQKDIIIAEKNKIQAKTAEKIDISIDKLVEKLKSIAFDDIDANKGDIIRCLELLGKYKGMFKEVNVNLNADIPTEPEAYKQWLKSELARVNSQDDLIDSYDRSEPAIATRY